MMTEHAVASPSLTTSKWLQWHSSSDVDVLMPQSPPPRSLQKSRISENEARLSVSLADSSSTSSSTPVSISEGAAMHAGLFRSMLSATAFREARERHVDLTAHDPDIARLVIEFLESEFEINGPFPCTRPRVAFQFPIAPDLVFDVLHAAAYFEAAELTKLCITMYRDFIAEQLVDADAVALLPSPILAEIAVGFDEEALRSFVSFLGDDVVQTMLTLREEQLRANQHALQQPSGDNQSQQQQQSNSQSVARRPLQY